MSRSPADAALGEGGRVVGIQPRFMAEREWTHTGLSELHLVETMAEFLDSHINYLRSAQARSTFARADIIRQGRRTSLVQVTCWQGDENKPIATGQVQLLLPTMAAQQEDRHGH